MSTTGSKRTGPPPSADHDPPPVSPSTVLHVPGIAPPALEPATVISKQPPLAATSGPASGPVAMLAQELMGQTLEHFEIQRFIGGGGMGAVFEALDTRLNRAVALKVLLREQGADSETSRRFLNEAQSAARLDHPGIARVYYVGEDRGWHYIALEYIEGANVRDLVEQTGPLPVADSVRYVFQLTEALSHASSRDVVHRDIKPSNVLITPSGRAKLVDLGLARLHQVEYSGGDLTASGVTLGTFDYISPEQARDPRGADARSDIYSLGCTWYYMLTGQPPFPDGTVLQKLLKHQGDAPPHPQTARPDLPDEAAEILLKMMAKDPRDRFQSPNELVGALLILANQLGVQPAATTEFVYLPPPGSAGGWLRRQLPWLAPVALLLGIVAAVQWVGQVERSADATIAEAGAERLENPPRANAERRAGSPNDAPRQAHDERQDTASGQSVGPPAAESTNPTATPSEPAAPTETLPRPDNSGQSPVDRPATNSSSRQTTSAAIVTEQGQAGAALHLEHESASLEPGRTAASATFADIPRSPVVTGASASSASGNGQPADPERTGNRSAAEGNSPITVEGVLVVDDQSRPGHFASLWAACAAAHSGDIIELRYNGRREERPMTLSNLDLTIRAGEGFAPEVAFAPRLTDPVGSPREMIRLAGGRLSLLNVRCQLTLPRDGAPSENWTLLATEGADALHVQNCAWTMVNEGPHRTLWHLNTALVEVRPPAGAMADAPAGADGEPSLEIRWDDSWARGAADFIRIREAGVVLRMTNAWLALGERFLVLQGASEAAVRVELEHATVHAGAGVFRVADAEVARISALATNCIFVGGPEAAVVASTKAAAAASAAPVRWKSDRCIYEGFEYFTRLGDGAAVKGTRWSEWRSFWGGGRDVWGHVGWREPLNDDRPFHERTPSEYSLAADSKATQAATDQGDIGMALDALPTAEPETAASDKSDGQPQRNTGVNVE